MTRGGKVRLPDVQNKRPVCKSGPLCPSHALAQVEGLRSTLGNGQALEFLAQEQLAQQDDLPNVLGEVRQLPHKGLLHGMGLGADMNRALQIRRRQRIDGVEQAVPPFVPACQ